MVIVFYSEDGDFGTLESRGDFCVSDVFVVISIQAAYSILRNIEILQGCLYVLYTFKIEKRFKLWFCKGKISLNFSSFIVPLSNKKQRDLSIMYASF